MPPSRRPKFRRGWSISLAIALRLPAAQGLPAQTIPVPENLWRLTSQEDTDGDLRLTVHDHVTPFAVQDGNGRTLRTVEGVYPLSVLFQELKRDEEEHRFQADLAQFRLDEPAADRTHRLIREYYWDALTRRVDAEHLDRVLADTKTASKYDCLYVPASDPAAVKYFRDAERAAVGRHRAPPLKVVVLPAPGEITGEFVRRLDGGHGLLSLKLELDARGRPVRGVPYVVPGGRFNELYYWDSYFIVLGLLQDGRTDLARGMADNLLYAMSHYGIVPNANRTYYLTRSQPPFLTSIIRAVHESGATDRKWLESALAVAAAEYQNVWMSASRSVSLGPYRLNRYFDQGSGPCPEVEPGHYDDALTPWRERAARNDGGATPTAFEFINQYLYCGRNAGVTVDGLALGEFFKHDRAERESGHDTTHRFDDRAADFVTVDLNSLLYRYEMDFAEILNREFGGHLASLGPDAANASDWQQRARARKEAMLALMWDDTRGFFFDYDFASKKRSRYISATGLYPLWAKILDARDTADRARAGRMAVLMRSQLEEPAGLAASARESVEASRQHDERQWDFPYGWAPHQMLAWEGLRNYGMDGDAERLAYRWLYTIAKNARDFNGMVTEKYNVVTGSHEVFAEYGNVGAKFSYIAPEGFGWMNASFQVGMSLLSTERLNGLRKLTPPEAVH